MAMETKLKAGWDYLPKYNWGYGMNDELAYADRAGFNTSVEALTSGAAHEWWMFGSLEVGNAYDLDPMGELRDDKTFAPTDPVAMGLIGMLPTDTVDTLPGVPNVGDGKSVTHTPQNYTPGVKAPTKGD